MEQVQRARRAARAMPPDGSVRMRNPYRGVRRKRWRKGGCLSDYVHVDVSCITPVDQGTTKGCFFAAWLYLRQFQGKPTPDVSTPDKFARWYTGAPGYRNLATALADVDASGMHYTWFQYSALGRATRQRVTFNPAVGPDICGYLRGLLDAGHPFLVGFDGHFCVCVGYNAAGFLALGSYGGGYHEIQETVLFGDAVTDCLWV
jgi:hypothetical protein